MLGDQGILKKQLRSPELSDPPVSKNVAAELEPLSDYCAGGLGGLTGSECCATFDLSMQLLGQPTSRARFLPTNLIPKP